MAQNKIVTDENLMESAKHGTDSYPFKCYFEKLSQFDFHCIDWHYVLVNRCLHYRKGMVFL